MSDPRVDLLAKHIASVLVTLIDIARDGSAYDSDGNAHPKMRASEVVLPTVGAPAEAQAQEEPAKRKGRPPKAQSTDGVQTAGSSPDTSESATAASSASATETSGPTDESPAAEPDTLATAQELTIKLVQTKGRDAAVGALGDFNVAKASALVADQIGAYCEAVRELLAG